MLKANSTKKNIIFSLVLQITNFVFPILMSAYLSRSIGAEGTGINAYTSSIVHYFVLFGSLGINLYGTREVAYCRDNREQLDKKISLLINVRFYSTLISLLIYIPYALFIAKYNVCALLQILYLVGNFFDISWAYDGRDRFDIKVKALLFCRFVNLIGVFIFVQQRGDVWKYVLIYSSTTLLSNLVIFLLLCKEICFVKCKSSELKKELISCLKLFVPQIAMEIYVVLDKTVLGLFCPIEVVGYYTYAESIVKVPIALISTLSSVLLPKMSNAYQKGDLEGVSKALRNSLDIVSIIGFEAMLGIILISDKMIPWLFGDEFIPSILAIKVLSPIIMFISFTHMIGYQYLLPIDHTKEFTRSVILGAGINLIGNFVFVPLLSMLGACISTCLAEGAVLIYQLIISRKALVDFRKVNILIDFCVALFIFILVYLLTYSMEAKIITTLLQILFFVIAFVMLSLLVNRKRVFAVLDVLKK